MVRTRVPAGVLAHVQMRRAKGEAWKLIQRDLAAAGLPTHVTAYWRALNGERARELARRHVAAWRARKQCRETGEATA